MPGKVKVKIISGKNLPVMDRSSDTTDAYVEIKLGNTTYKTDVCRRTLNPHWNTDWYRFEVDDSELQDEPLQIRLMDHDTYSANDAIGKVYLNLNPLLLPVAGQLAIGDNNPHHEISGWIPVYDTMHGIRGEVNVTVKVELFSDFNRFRQSSCGVHFFYSPTIPQGYQAKIINGFVEELIVDDDPEYQWIDKIRTPRASNEARQTLFFKLSGELQRKIGVKALGLGGNAVIGYRQCFDLEGESGIVARGIGTAVSLVKAYNVHHVVVETKEEKIENYLKFIGDGKSFSLRSTLPENRFHFPFSLLNCRSPPDIASLSLNVPILTKHLYASSESNIVSPSISNPDLHEGHKSIKVLLNQEDKRGKSAMSRRFQKFKHSQKSLSKKMIALKAKLNESIGEESDDSQAGASDKRKFFKRTSSDSSAMAEILARSVIRATTSLSSILEDQPHTHNEDETMEKLNPIANLLSQTDSEVSGLDEMASDAQSCSSTDSSSDCSDYEYRGYSKTNNDVETISNIITNVEKLQRSLSREGLHKQYSLPAIPTKGFSLSSLDNLTDNSQAEFEEKIYRSENSLDESMLSVSSSVSNFSTFDEYASDRHLASERRSSDAYDSRINESRRPSNRARKLERFEEVDLPEASSTGSVDGLEFRVGDFKTESAILNNSQEIIKAQTEPDTIVNTALQTKISEERVKTLGHHISDHNMIVADKNPDQSKMEAHITKPDPSTIVNTVLPTMVFERAKILGTPGSELEKEKFEFPGEIEDNTNHKSEHSHWPKIFNSKLMEHAEPKGIVGTALQTMLIERADMLGADGVTKSPSLELHETHKDIHGSSRSDDRREGEPKGIVKTALQTMLIERADLLGTPDVQAAQEEEFSVSSRSEAKGIVKTALQTMLIERADLLGTPDVQTSKEEPLESHSNKHEKGDIWPKSITNTALQTMLFERANLMGPTADRPLEPACSTLYDAKQKTLIQELEADNSNSSTMAALDDKIHQLYQYPGECNEDINVIAPVSLEKVNIQPKKMVKTAMQTMLLEKFNLLGTYTPPTSPSSLTDDLHSGKAKTFTFTEIESHHRKTIPKSSSSASFGEHQRQKDSVLGMPFASLSSLISEYESGVSKQRTGFLSDSHLHQPIIETLKEKAGRTKKRFKFRLSKAGEHGKTSGMFQKFRRSSKKSISDDNQKDATIPKEHHQNIISRMFHTRQEDRSSKDEETQTSIEVLDCPKTSQSPECIFPNNNMSKPKNLIIAPPEPPSNIDLASGDFLAHSKTKSACITSHHSSPAQEKQDGERKDAHSPDPVVRISHSPVKVNYMVPLHRRSSDSDLSITPKGNSLTGSDKSMGNNAAYFMRNHYIRRGQMNQEHFDMLEYPFLTMTKFPARFIIQIGGSISARSVKLLERISNVDEPESRDTWWSEIRLEIRSHARSLNCNAVLGYTELTSICDDVCVLSACGTAAVIDFSSSDDENFSNVQLIHKNVERDKHVNGHQKSTQESPDHRVIPVYSCCVTHLPYDEKTVPVKAKITKCPMCLKGKVPEVLIATIEPPELVPSVGKGCFIESHVTRSLKDLKGETIAKEISDGLPFLEYELHRLLVNKLKIKGMNAIFSLKIRITVGEKFLVGVATGTAIYLSCLPPPDLPVLVTDKVSDEKLVAELQEMLNQTVKKNKEIYQIKDDNQNQKCLSDEDSDEDQGSLDISCGNKDCCILEMDDPEDAEVLRLLMQEKVPEGFHVVSTESVPGLEELEVVKNLQMFTQIYRAKLVPPYNLQNHFVRLLQSVYFKLRRMVPCALCDLQFRIDIPEPDEIQLCVIGMALGLGKKVKNNKTVMGPKKPEEDLMFKIDDDHAQDISGNPFSKSNPSSIKIRCHRSPSKYRQQSVKQRHIPYNERHGVDITPLSYVPGGNIEQYLGNLNFFFIRETTSIREEGGLSGFTHSFITEVLAIVRSHVTALGGNALVAFFMTECILNHNLHKNQGQCLINVGGDVVSVSYFKDEN